MEDDTDDTRAYFTAIEKISEKLMPLVEGEEVSKGGLTLPFLISGS